MAMLVGVSTVPPMPMSTRKASSQPMVGATAQSAAAPARMT